MQLFNRFINNYVDFENKVTYFESDDFKSKLDTMCRLLNASKEDFPDFIFDDLYINRSLSLMVRKYAYYKSENETPVICRGLVKSDNDYSAFVQVGFGINSNTHFEKQAYAFLKFALSEDVQTKMCGAKGISYSANISFPVNKKAFELKQHKTVQINMLKHNKTSDTQHCPALIRHEFKKQASVPPHSPSQK